MLFLKIWLATSLLIGGCWALAGLLLGRPESSSGADATETKAEAEAEDEAA